MPTEIEISNLINKHLVDKFTATDDLLGMLLRLQYDNNNLLSHIININLNHIYNENQDYTNLDIDNSKIFAGNYGVTLGNAESSDLVTCVINGRPIVCIAKSDVGQYERVIVVPGGSDTEPHIVALGILIKGNYEGTPKVVATDESGNLISEIVGSEGISVLQNVIGALISEMQGSEGVAVKQEATGELVSVMQGNQGLDVKQDAITGALISEMQGSEGVAVKQEATGELVSVMQGNQGIDIKQKATTGEMISVMQGAEGVDVAQDASGAFESVMKGVDGAGALQTAGLNSDGKFEMYLYDQTDVFGTKISIGLSELAQRIGIPILHEKEGHVSWYDSFESPVIKWNKYTNIASSAISLTTEYVREGNMALKLITADDVAAYAQIERMEQLWNETTTGFSFAFLIQQAQTVYSFTSEMKMDDDTNEYTAQLKWTKYLGRLEILNSSGTYTIIASSVDLYRTANLHKWDSFKLTVNWDTKKYIKCFIRGVEYDLSAYDIYTSATTHNITNTFGVKLEGSGSGNNILIIDNVIYTIAEPVS